MATLEQETEERGKLSALLTELSQISPDSLVRRDELGADLSFEAGVPYFDRTLRLFEKLRNASLDGVPLPQLQQLTQATTQALNEFKAIQTFSLATNPQNPIGARDNLIDQVNGRYDTYFGQMTPVISYSVRKGTDFEAIERQAREILKQLHDARTEQAKLISQTKTQADEFLTTMRQVAAEAGVSQHAIYFKDEADAHRKASWLWLLVTLVFAIATFWFALHSLNFVVLTPLSPAQSIQVGIAKLFAFSVLYFALIWAGRNYLAVKHNQIVNKHRQNALSTFQAFVKAAGSDEATKNAVLIKATEAIFSPEVTGYLGKEPDPRATSQIIELVRGIEGK